MINSEKCRINILRNGHGYLQQYGTDEYGEPDWVVGALGEYPGAKTAFTENEINKIQRLWFPGINWSGVELEEVEGDE